MNKQNDDILIAHVVADCLHVMKNCPTRTKMTACYNLTERICRLFAVQGEKEDLLSLVDDFHQNVS